MVKFKVFSPYRKKLAHKMEIDSKNYFCVNDFNKNIKLTQGRESHSRRKVLNIFRFYHLRIKGLLSKRINIHEN